MTLNDIIVAALAQLDRGHDAQSLDVWRDKLTRFANEAVQDLAGAYSPRTTEAITVNNGVLDISGLSNECVRVYKVARDGIALSFFASDTGKLQVNTGETGGVQVDVTYRYAPADMTSPTDVPALPSYMHGLIVCYVVGRERAAGDVSLQRGGNVYFQMYQAGKAGIRPHLGDAESYRIVNRW